MGSSIAVEIESRVSKQVRGAVMDLLFHRHPKKLLVLIPVHMTDPDSTAEQCRFILGQFLNGMHFRVVVLRGTDEFPSLEPDAASVRAALIELG